MGNDIKYFRNGDLLGAELGTNPSMVWRGIIDGLGVLKAGTCWRIGDGATARIWRDRWIPDLGVLSQTNDVEEPDWEVRVKTLIDQNASWNLGKLQQLFPIEVVEKIQNIPLSKSCQKDRLIWSHTANGRFTVKLAYKFAWNAVHGQLFQEYNELMKPVWNAVWFMDIPPKVKHFLWRFIWGILPTKSALQSRGVDITLSCSVCELHDESRFHLFFECPWSLRVWAGACPFFHVSGIRESFYLDDFLNLFLTLSREQKEGVAVTLWTIWSNRNNCAFKGRCSQPEFSVRWISKYLVEYRSVGDIGNQIRQPLQRTLSAVWQPPQADTVKINVDAAVPHNQHITSLGVVLRNNICNVLGAAQKTCRFTGSVLQAEIMAIDFAMQIGKEFGCKKIEVESDSLQAVAIANSNEDCFLPFGAIVEELRLKKSFFDCISFLHVKRDCNVLAHELAHLPSPTPPWEGVWFGSLPQALCSDMV